MSGGRARPSRGPLHVRSCVNHQLNALKVFLGKDVMMRLFALALTLSLADFAAVSAQTATPDSENGRYSFSPVADGVLRLDTRTGQVSQCSRNAVAWACKLVPDERSVLETEIARLQGENGTLK